MTSKKEVPLYIMKRISFLYLLVLTYDGSQTTTMDLYILQKCN